MSSESELKSKLAAIKKPPVLFLPYNEIPHSDIAKAAGIGRKTLYKFLPKNLGKKLN